MSAVLSRPVAATCRIFLSRLYESRLFSMNTSYIIDMRSDVLTKPTPYVLQAMTTSTLDDDIFREDKTIIELEMKMAKMFNKEAALFVLSGTMANLIAVSCHCKSRGMEVLLGDKSHVFMWEQAGIAQFAGLQPHVLPNLPDGSFDLDLFESSIRPRDDPHQPFTGLAVVENTHNYCGGKVISVDFLSQLKKRAEHYGIPVHMDGARILNASVALKVSPDILTSHVDSISFCFSKLIANLCGILSDVMITVVKNKDTAAKISPIMQKSGMIRMIKIYQQNVQYFSRICSFHYRALRMRKAVGGGWRKAGPLAAAALAALEDAPQRFQQDHVLAQRFAQVIKSSGKSIVNVDVNGVHTNIIMVELLKKDISAESFCRRLSQVTNDEFAELHEKIVVRVAPSRRDRHIRVCTMSNLSPEDIDMALKKWQFVIREFQCSN